MDLVKFEQAISKFLTGLNMLQKQHAHSWTVCLSRLPQHFLWKIAIAVEQSCHTVCYLLAKLCNLFVMDQGNLESCKITLAEESCHDCARTCKNMVVPKIMQELS